MKKFFRLSAVILILSACGSGHDKKFIRETYSDGSPKVEKYYKDNDTTKEMVKEVRYYPNKQKQMEGEYKDTKRNGDWVYYYQNGKKWSEGSFAEGLDDGKRTVYYENGQVRYQGNYNKGRQVGIWKFWDETGKLQKEINYDKTDSTASKL
jgi:antitoxin component YwqK of YwqJK toxin-antitoxin module